eukprot:TRINITY_DN3755_c1_g2_i1.p1 TRINITY_DN3755_c1_g2~~TRINITY_DN3755_c1_g2_i1.p1  ORF type:complete len:345 (+),score=72.37 TRINITY_DN3755_c1_g2_i1:74-1036(+)
MPPFYSGIGATPRGHWDPQRASPSAKSPSFVTQAQRTVSASPSRWARAAPARAGYDRSGCGAGYATTREGLWGHERAALQPRRSPPPPPTDTPGPQPSAKYQQVQVARSPSEIYSDQVHSEYKVRSYDPAADRILPERKTLVIDLDETLVHSCFDPCECDLRIPLTMDGQQYVAYVKKRPGCDEFLRRSCELFDVVIWTASLQLYAGPLIDELVRGSGCGQVRRMYRSSCTQLEQGYAKDLTILGRSLDHVAIVDNTPGVALFQPSNLISVTSWFEDPDDGVLVKLIPTLQAMYHAGSVYDVLCPNKSRDASRQDRPPWR